MTASRSVCPSGTTYPGARIDTAASCSAAPVDVSRSHGDERRRAVGRDVAQPHDDLGIAPLSEQAQMSDGTTEDAHVLDERPVDRGGRGIFRALVQSEVGRIAIRAPHGRVHALRRDPRYCHGSPCPTNALATSSRSRAIEHHPGTRTMKQMLVGTPTVLHERLDCGIALDPVVVVLQPMPPPTHLACDPIEVRTGQHVMRPAVTPRADYRPRVCRPRRETQIASR